MMPTNSQAFDRRLDAERSMLETTDTKEMEAYIEVRVQISLRAFFNLSALCLL
jgi:hypothetical protein